MRTTAAMRVCHLTSVHPALDVRIFHKECRSLAAAGYDTHLVAPGARSETRHGVHLHGVATAPGGRLSRMALTTEAVYQKARAVGADLYHFHDPELIPVGLRLRALGKQVVYDIHEDMPLNLLSKHYLPRGARRVLSMVIGVLEQLAGQRLSALVAATPTIASRFLHLGPAIVVISNYPRGDEFPQRSPLPWTERHNSVAYVGGLSAERGLRQMVEAIGLVDERLTAGLLLAGPFARERERVQASALVGWQRVRPLGTLDRGAVAELLHGACAGLVVLSPDPRYVASQPIKLYEYMAAGIAVIASDFPLWRAIIERHRCGLLVDPLDPRSIAAAIEYMLTHPAEAEAMGQRGRRAMEHHYTWEAESKKLVALYETLR